MKCEQYVGLVLKSALLDRPAQIHVFVGSDASNSADITHDFRYQQLPVFDFYKDLLDESADISKVLERYVHNRTLRNKIYAVFSENNLVDENGHPKEIFRKAIMDFKEIKGY